MAITALGGTTGIAKQFRQKVPVKNTRRPKKDGDFQLKLNQTVQPLGSGIDLRA
jgi:hypothetical protein